MATIGKTLKAFMVVLMAAVLMSTAFGCTKPCVELAQMICGCQPTQNMQAICYATFVSGNPVDISDADQNTCSSLLNTCSCAQLEVGNLAACGIANPTPGDGTEP